MPPSLRPDTYRLPDRAAWQGPIKPYALAGFPDEVAHGKMLVHSDLSTIDADDAHTIQDEIHLLCDSVAAAAGIPDSDLCFFDAEDGRFWIFPVATFPSTPIEQLDPR